MMDVSKKYVKGELKGAGSYKSVFQAYDKENNRIVAFNEVGLSGLDESRKERIFREVELLKKLNHVNILPIYDSWVSNNYFRFTTEMMSCSLSDYIRSQSKIRMTDLKNWARQILEGLCYIHSKKIIHRDLKCDNIFIDIPTSTVKIGDFGLSTSLLEQRFAVSLIGTPNYLAPECFEEEYDEKVDVWAYGMCILELFTGDYPYSEYDSPLHVIKAIMTGKYPQSLHTVTAPLCKDLIELCLKNRSSRPYARELLSHAFFQYNIEHENLMITYPKGNFSHLFSVRSIESDKNTQRNVTSTSQNRTISVAADSRKAKSTVAIIESSIDDILMFSVYMRINDLYKKIKISFDKKSDTPAGIASDLQSYFQLSEKEREKIESALIEAMEQHNHIYGNEDYNGSPQSIASSSSKDSENSGSSQLSEGKKPNISSSDSLDPFEEYPDDTSDVSSYSTPQPYQSPMTKAYFVDRLRSLDSKLEKEIQEIDSKIHSLQCEKQKRRFRYSLERSRLLEDFLSSGEYTPSGSQSYEVKDDSSSRDPTHSREGGSDHGSSFEEIFSGLISPKQTSPHEKTMGIADKHSDILNVFDEKHDLRAPSNMPGHLSKPSSGRDLQASRT